MTCILERQITNGGVRRAVKILKKRVIPKSVVAESIGVAKQRKGAKTIVIVGACDAVTVIDKRVGSIGAVLCAGAVEQKRRGASGRIGIRIVEDKRSAAKSCVIAAGGIVSKRIPANCCVSKAGSQVQKRMASFRCRVTGVAPVRAW